MVSVPRTPPRYGGQRLLLAYHESGHAVVARTLGCTVRLVTTRLLAGDEGACAYRYEIGSLTVRDRITLKMAGLEAERLLLAGAGYRLAEGARAARSYGCSDERHIRRALLCALEGERVRSGVVRLSDGLAAELSTHYQRGAREILSDPRCWQLVQRVATALLEGDGEMGQAGFERLLGPDTPRVLRYSTYVLYAPKADTGMVLFNPNHDARGRFGTTGGGGEHESEGSKGKGGYTKASFAGKGGKGGGGGKKAEGGGGRKTGGAKAEGEKAGGGKAKPTADERAAGRAQAKAVREAQQAAYHTRQDAQHGYKPGTSATLEKHGFYVFNAPAHEGGGRIYTISREDGKAFLGQNMREGEDGHGQRAVFSPHEVSHFADLVAAHPGTIVPRTDKAQEALIRARSARGNDHEIKAPTLAATRAAHDELAGMTTAKGAATKAAKAPAKSIHERAARLQREGGLKAEAKPGADLKPQEGYKPTERLISYDEWHAHPIENAVRVYGEHQLGAFLTQHSIRDLRDLAESHGVRASNTKAETVSRITAHVTEGRYSADFGAHTAAGAKGAKGAGGKGAGGKAKPTAESIHERAARLQREGGLPREARPGETLTPRAGTHGARFDPMAHVDPHQLVNLYGEHQLGNALHGYTKGRLDEVTHDLGIKSGRSNADTVSRITAHVTEGRYSADFGAHAGAKGAASAGKTGEAVKAGGGKPTAEERYQAKRTALQQEIAGHRAEEQRIATSRIAKLEGRPSTHTPDEQMQSYAHMAQRMDAEAKLARLDRAHAKAIAAPEAAKASRTATRAAP
jgi:hypothetical protein